MFAENMNYYDDSENMEKIFFGTNDLEDEEFAKSIDEERYMIKKENTFYMNWNDQKENPEKPNDREVFSDSKEKTNFTRNITEFPTTKKDKKVSLIKGEIFTITKEGKEFKENENKKEEVENEINNDFQNLGKKRKLNNDGKHDKFCKDNMTRKLKTKLFDSLLYFTNSSIKPSGVQNNSKKYKYSKLFFMKTNQKTIKDINVTNNRALLNRKLKDIFSEDISIKLEKYGLDHNRYILSEIESQEINGEKIQSKTLAILEKTFLQCLEHFRGTKYYEELKGLELEYDKVINEMKDKGEGKEYIDEFEKFVLDFEQYYEDKKPRRPRAKHD